MTVKSSVENYKKDWLLMSSALLTWSLVSFVALQNVTSSAELFIRASGYLLFIFLFFVNILAIQPINKNNNIGLLVIQTLLVLTLLYFDKNDITSILTVLIATQLPHVYSRYKALIFLIILNVFLYIIFIMTHPYEGIFTVLTYFLLQIFGFSAIELTLKEKAAKEKLSAINQELLATRYMLKESTKQQERLRISRDLHDVLGHQLTALSINLEVTTHKVPPAYRPLLEQNRDQAKALLNEVREVVREMRHQDQFDLVDAINALIKQLPSCHLKVVNTVSINALKLKQQLVFCLQEGISNALRHGHATELTLDFVKNNNQITVLLSDNGVGDKNHQLGNGLLGMKERLADFYGQINLTSNVSGCQLEIKVEDNYD